NDDCVSCFAKNHRMQSGYLIRSLALTLNGLLNRNRLG
ncbi:hypothetical protein WANA34_0894, partial [Wolbachia endosymbiont of Drosophila ananassae]